MKTKYIIALIIFVVVAGVSYWYFFLRMTKEKAIKIILDNGLNKNADFLNGADSGYLIAWAKAFNKADEQFSYKDKNYNVTGGKAA